MRTVCVQERKYTFLYERSGTDVVAMCFHTKHWFGQRQEGIDQNPTAETHHHWHAKRTQKVGSEMAGNEGVLPFRPRAAEAGTPFYEVNFNLEADGDVRAHYFVAGSFVDAWGPARPVAPVSRPASEMARFISETWASPMPAGNSISGESLYVVQGKM